MPNLISRVVGLPEASSGRRPQMLEFQGINWNCPQGQNLLAFFPMWEPPGVPVLDLGPLGLIGQPLNVLRTQDPYFGDVYQGDGVTGGGTTARGYKIPYSKELNFGLGPSPFSLSCWFNVTLDPTVDYYLFTYDDPASTPVAFAGYACSFDTGQVVACNTGSATQADAGFKSTTGFFDGRWHHFCFSHLPNPAIATGAINTYYVDGRFNNQNSAQSNVGPVSTARFLTIGVDDDFASQPFSGQFCDLRIYGTALGATEAAQMWHPDTRWELYQPARKSFYVPVAVAAGAPFVAPDPYVVRQAVNRASYY